MEFSRLFVGWKKHSLGSPFFSITAFKLENATFSETVHTRITSLKMTTVSNQIIDFLQVKTKKRWSGTQFFGFDRNEIQNILKYSRTQINKNKRKVCEDEISDNQQDLLLLSANNSSRNENVSLEHYLTGASDLCPWLGVRQFGRAIAGQFAHSFERSFNEKKYFLRDGYTAQRGIKCEDGKSVLVTCKVLANGSTSMPLFVCEAEGITVKCDNVTTSVSRILQSFKAITKRHWSGFEFFGFHRADVLRSLSLKNDELKRLTGDHQLQQIQNIRSRNAGPTSELKSKSGMKKRNDKIDGIVNYVSFGDVKSMYCSMYLYIFFIIMIMPQPFHFFKFRKH